MVKPHNYIIVTLTLIVIIMIIIIILIIIKIIIIAAKITIIVTATGPVMRYDGNGLFLLKKGNKHLKKVKQGTNMGKRKKNKEFYIYFKRTSFLLE